MKKLFIPLLLLLFTAGCNQQAQVKQPALNPSTPSPQVLVAKTPAAAATPAPGAKKLLKPVRGIGQVSRHTKNFINREVAITGYMLVHQQGYVIFSDEIGGALGYYDLPVTGPGLDALQFKQKYILQGVLKTRGLVASNHNPYHFEASLITQ